MRILSWGSAMVPAHRLLNLAQNRNPLGARLPLPEQDKSLAAHTATELSVPVRAFAKDLHLLSVSLPRGSLIPPVNIVNRTYR
jgi:hypothetical protein